MILYPLTTLVALVAASPFGNADAAPAQNLFCSAVKTAVTLARQQSTASAFCSSYLRMLRLAHDRQQSLTAYRYSCKDSLYQFYEDGVRAARLLDS